MPTRRLFFALDLDQETHGTLVSRVEELRACAEARWTESPVPGAARRARGRPRPPRFTQPTGWHMTLHFLGDVDEELLDELIASVRGLDPTQLLGEGPLDADWAGFSAFPNPRRARVIVARSTDPEGRLGALAAHFGEVARRFDLPIEERAYRPHVTVARVQALNVAGLCEAVPLTGPIRFSAVHLYESELTPEGSRYRSLAHAVTT